jgi:hypothetical protein
MLNLVAGMTRLKSSESRVFALMTPVESPLGEGQAPFFTEFHVAG